MDSRHLVRMPDDIAVIEQMFGGDWRVLGHIGPDREDLVLEALSLYRGGSIRIRYLASGVATGGQT